MSGKLKTSELNKLSPQQVLEDERIQQRFVKLVNGITGTKGGSQMYHREQRHFISAFSENKDLRQCTPVSIFNAFMDVAVLGLSVAKGTQPLAYLIPYSVNVGTRENPQYEKRVNLEVSPYGELSLRKNYGQIQDVDNPVIVYKDDMYREYSKAGKLMVDYEKNPESEDRTIKAGFIRIVKTNGDVDFHTMDMAKVERLRQYSLKKNQKGGRKPDAQANPLYTSNGGQIDEGFFEAKIIKHAFKSYPKAPYMQQVTAAVLQTEKKEVDVSSMLNMDDDAPEKREVEDADFKVVDGVEMEPGDESY